DEVVSDNCPRTVQFWSVACGTVGERSADRMSPRELRAIAANIDARSRHFNWTNDLTGFCAALNPPRPMTQRKRLVRQYAALLANVAAGDGYTSDGDSSIGLDLDTPVRYGRANTIRELIDLVE